MTVSLTTAELAKYIDATALKADTSEADVRRLVAESREAGVKSVCINPVWVPLVAAELAGSDVLTCTVIGFPLGANASEVKAFEARQAIDAGADEVDAAVSAARRGWRGDPSGNGCGYTKAGVILDDLLPEADRPAMLFQPDRPRDARLTDALDAINDRFGKKTMVLAREGFAGEWRLRADHRSPRYTTRISELPTVRV